MANARQQAQIGEGSATKILVSLVALVSIMALSGAEYAHAQTLDTGAPLYLKSVDPVTTPCTPAADFTGTSTGSGKFSSEGLSTNHTFAGGSDKTFTDIAYIEINSQSTNKSIAVYNFPVSSMSLFHAMVPIDALGTISDDPENEVYTARPIYSLIDTDVFTELIFINNTAITGDIYQTFQSYFRGTLTGVNTFLVPGGVDTVLVSGSATQFDRADPPNLVLCSAGHAMIDLSPPTFVSFPEERIIVKGEYAPLEDLTCTDSVAITNYIAGIVPPLPNGDKLGDFEERYRCTDDAGNEATETVQGKIVSVAPVGNNKDWQLNPTFGRSWTNHAQIVSGGFEFNGVPTDIIDNFHTAFKRTAAEIGEINTIKAKIYTEMTLEQVILSLGVPEPSRVTDAEAEIMIKLRPDYTLPEEYRIVDIIHEQKENLIDMQSTASWVQKVKCKPDSERYCHEFTITFMMTAPLVHDVVAVSAMDTDRRITTTYINHGIGFEGEPLLPLLTHTLYSKKGNQHPVEETRLVQPDRRYNVWNDQHGYVWMKNSYGSWFQLTHAGFERLNDPYSNVMTRTHSNFADLVEYEKERARQVFDAESIKSTVGESFSHDTPVRIDKLDDPKILEKLKIAELAALEYLASR